MLAGTGDGPPLAEALLLQGWQLRVSVVSAAAHQAYAELRRRWPAEALVVLSGALQGPGGITAQLHSFAAQGTPVRAVLDATHPFATRISRDLQEACGSSCLPLLRLGRPLLPLAGAELLPDLQALRAFPLSGERLLLALGGRQLAEAVRCSPGALHHARVLPQPLALQQAMAAGLAPERVACLRPRHDFAVERALLQRWRIGTIVCRQSGGPIEAGWQQLAQRDGRRLLLLQRPTEGVEALPRALVLRKLKLLLELTLGGSGRDGCESGSGGSGAHQRGRSGQG